VTGERRARSGRAIAVPLTILCLPICLGGVALAVVLGPLRDSTAVTSFLDGVTGDDAKLLCRRWAGEEWAGPAATVTALAAERRGDPAKWHVTGVLAAGDVTGPMTCTISSSGGGAVVRLDEITFPNGQVGGIDHAEDPASGP
jgi:hypothetical protein